MALVLGAGAYCEWLEAAEILAVFGFSEGQARSLAAQTQSQETLAAALDTQHSLLLEEKQQLQDLEFSLDQFPHRRVVLLYADLPLALSSIVQQAHKDVVESRAIWKQSLSQLQALYRKHRGQVLLFELGQVLKNPQQFLQVCASEWQKGLPEHLPEFSRPDDIDPIIGLLAQQVLQEQPDLQQQLLYIQAMTWPLGDKLEHTSSALSAGDLGSYVQERYDLIQKLKRSKIREAEQALHLQQLKKQLSKATAKQNEIKQEGELVLEQLLLAQEALEKKITAYTDLDQKFLGLTDKLSQHIAELAQLKASYQQSLQKQESSTKELEQRTQHLREQQRLLDQSQQQAAQLESQKHALSEELAQLKALYQQSLQKQESSTKELEQRTQQLREQQRLLDQSKQQAAQLESQKHALSEELAQLKASYQQSLQKQESSTKEVDQRTQQLQEQQRLLDQSQQQIAQLANQKHVLSEELAQLKTRHEQSLDSQKAIAQQAQDLSEENQLILEQLLLAQEELERRILAERDAAEKIKELQSLSKENNLLIKQLHQTQEALEDLDLQQTNITIESPVTAQSEETESRDLVVVSDLRIHAPDHTVPPHSFFERRAYKKEQRLARRRDRERAAQIAQTPWFDAAWYLEQYPDIAADPVQSENPALHYMRMGGFEGRNPSPHFDSAFYLAANPDVVEAGLNPLWHFLQNGQAEGRQPQP
ncbi:hypothetical protein ACBP93_10345 [Paenalcaligenes hominis]|uniref:hypothetical protein n=1 Tax=Paenalcaligenes hominis TaxID=643674 RepID=UPI00352453B9